MRKMLVLACMYVGLMLSSLGASEVPGKVDINAATIAELDTLPGIGPAIAARIIDFRTRNGPFRRIEDLMNVRGIGEKKYLKLKGRVFVSPSESRGAKPAPSTPGAKASRTAPPKRR